MRIAMRDKQHNIGVDGLNFWPAELLANRIGVVTVQDE